MIETKQQSNIRNLCKSDDSLQKYHTPYGLCEEIIQQLCEYIDLENSSILVMFNLEFVSTLINKAGVDPENITFMSDSEIRNRLAELLGVKIYRYNPFNLINNRGEMKAMDKQFDVVIGNPPYNAPKLKESDGRGGRNTIWESFVILATKLVNENGYLSFIHPPRWRKPKDKTWALLTQFDIKFIRFFDAESGRSYFESGTRFDYYVLQKKSNHDHTSIIDEKGISHSINIQKWPWLPSCEFNLVYSILAIEGEKVCPVMYSRSFYGRDKIWMSEKKSKKYFIPCVHSILKNEVRYMYSSVDKGFLGIPKVIISENGTINDVVIDMKGNLAFTSGCFAIPISSKKEGEGIRKALMSEKFDRLVQATKWSSFRIEYQMFKYFRHDFWKDFN